MERHVQSLNSLCRGCARTIVINKSYINAKTCQTYSNVLYRHYEIDIELEDKNVYPKLLCSNCKRKLDILHKSPETTEKKDSNSSVSASCSGKRSSSISNSKLSNSLNSSSDDKSIGAKIQFGFIFDMMCCRIENWKRFLIKLEIEHVISERDLRENEKYKDFYEKINKCIAEKIESSKEELGWDYWRKVLLEIDEANLVEDIEEKYSDLILNENIDISNVDHHMIKKFGILSHDAGRTENFIKLPVKQKDDIKVCVSGGARLIYSLESANTMQTVQDAYFNKFNIFEKIKKYDFSTIGKSEECLIVQTLYAWLNKNQDNGFCIKGYDVNEHLKLISEDYVNKNPNDSYVLVYSTIDNVIFYIDTNPTSIKMSMRYNRSNIRTLLSANQCLDGHPFVYIPITVYDPKKVQIDHRVICKTCIELQLVVASNVFKDLKLFEHWWKEILNEINNIKDELKANTDISNVFLKSIIGFMTLAPFNLPNYTTLPRKEIQEAQKLIMLTPEQQNIVYSKNKRKIIKGAFGSGKTVVAQQLIKHVVSNVSDFEFVYYLFHDPSRAFVQEMKNFAKTFDNNKLIACQVSDLVGDNRSLSSILRHLSQICIGNTAHVFIEEFNGEVLDEGEVEAIDLLLKNKIFLNSHIALVCQSMESERYLIVDKDRLLYNKYQFQKLTVETHFEIFQLSYLLRSSEHINNIVDVAIPTLHRSVMESIVPGIYKNSAVQQPSRIRDADKLSQSTSTSNASQPTSSTAVDLNNKLTSRENLLTDIAQQRKCLEQESKALSDEAHLAKTELIQPLQTDSSVNFEESFAKEDFSEQLSTQIRDTDKILKHYTVNSKQYEFKKNLISSFYFIGERVSSHIVNGTKPVVYSTFVSEPKNKSFRNVFKRQKQNFNHQIYWISKVLQKIYCSNENEKQVIICMNDDSKHMVQMAVNKTKWTENPRLLTTTLTFLTDYISVRGCEFINVILIYPIDEQHLKHNLINALNRCILNLKIIVLNGRVPDKTLETILNEWEKSGLVVIDDEIFLKNVSQNELQEFYKINKQLLVEDNLKQLVNVNDANDAEAIQNLFGKILFDKRPVPVALTYGIWNKCKTAKRSALKVALKKNNININSIYKFEEYVRPVSLLHYAVYQNNLSILNFLLKMQIDVNITDSFSGSPLHVAVHNNNFEIVKILLQVDTINVNLMDDDGWIALHKAAAHGYVNITKLLLQDKSIDVNITALYYGTSLHAATVNHNTYILRLLLNEKNIDINKSDHEGNSPLHKAAFHNYRDIVRLLLFEDNIDVNKGNNENDTPLHVTSYKWDGSFDLLLKHTKIDVNMVNKKGRSALHQAASFPYSNDSIKELLKQNNIMVNIKDNIGWTRLHVAAYSNNIFQLRVFSTTDGIDLHSKDVNGATPLDIATQETHKEIIRELMRLDRI